MASQGDVAMTTETAPKPTTKKSTQHITSRNPPWTYFKLQLIPHSKHPIKNFAVDPLTARSYLTSALSQFLGLMGTSIGIDILKIENPPSTSEPKKKASRGGSDYPNVWIRVPRDDGAAVLAALSSWVGSLSSSSVSGKVPGDSEGTEEAGIAWRVCAKGNYLSAIVHGSGQNVFNP